MNRASAGNERRDSEEAAVIAIRLAELDGALPPLPDDPIAFEAKVTSMTDDLVEPAKSKTYNELGDGRGAQSIAAAWLRARPMAVPSTSRP